MRVSTVALRVAVRKCHFPSSWVVAELFSVRPRKGTDFQLLLRGTHTGRLTLGSGSAEIILHMHVHTPCASLVCRPNHTGPDSSPYKTFPPAVLLSLSPSVGTFFLITLNSIYSHHWIAGVFFMQHTRDTVPVSLLCGNFLVCCEAALR